MVYFWISYVHRCGCDCWFSDTSMTSREKDNLLTIIPQLFDLRGACSRTTPIYQNIDLTPNTTLSGIHDCSYSTPSTSKRERQRRAPIPGLFLPDKLKAAETKQRRCIPFHSNGEKNPSKINEGNLQKCIVHPQKSDASFKLSPSWALAFKLHSDSQSLYRTPSSSFSFSSRVLGHKQTRRHDYCLKKFRIKTKGQACWQSIKIRACQLITRCLISNQLCICTTVTYIQFPHSRTRIIFNKPRPSRFTAT